MPRDTYGSSSPVPSSLSDGSSPPPSTLTLAGTEVYMIPELRTRILRFLDRQTQAIFMRVEKKGMAVVAAELYHSVSYSHVRSRMSVTNARRRMYCDSVQIVDTRGLVLTPVMRQQLGIDAEALFAQERGSTKKKAMYLWSHSYRPELLDIIIPPLLKKCASLRRVIFGGEYTPADLDPGVSYWIVDLDRSEERSVRCAELGSGHITYFKTLSFDSDAPPPAVQEIASEFPEPPCDRYTLTGRFDLKIKRAYRLAAPAYADRWLTAITDGRLVDVYQAVDFGDLPVSVEHIVSLYQRQIAAGHEDRLAIVKVSGFVNYNYLDFRSFAKIAGSSLTCLVLGKARGHGVTADDDTGAIQGGDFPFFFTLVKRHLKNLTELCFMLRDIDVVEATCLQSLASCDTLYLEVRGAIANLTAYTPPGSTVVPFSILRYLSPLITDDAKTSVGDSYAYQQKQFGYIRYLRGQSAQRRRHLACIDFSTVGIHSLAAVSKLTYYKDGEPQHAGVTQADKWVNRTSGSKRTLENTLVPQLQRGLDQLEQATRDIGSQYREIELVELPPNEVQTNQLLKAMQKQLDAVQKVEGVAMTLDEILSATRRTASEIREAMRVMGAATATPDVDLDSERSSDYDGA